MRLLKKKQRKVYEPLTRDKANIHDQKYLYWETDIISSLRLLKARLCICREKKSYETNSPPQCYSCFVLSKTFPIILNDDNN